jgi:hypothetical protein
MVFSRPCLGLASGTSVWVFWPKYTSSLRILNAILVLGNKKDLGLSSARARFSIRSDVSCLCVRHCCRMRTRALLDRMSSEFGVTAARLRNRHWEAAQFKSLVSPIVTGWTGLGKPVTWTTQKQTFSLLLQPQEKQRRNDYNSSNQNTWGPARICHRSWHAYCDLCVWFVRGWGIHRHCAPIWEERAQTRDLLHLSSVFGNNQNLEKEGNIPC